MERTPFKFRNQNQRSLVNRNIFKREFILIKSTLIAFSNFVSYDKTWSSTPQSGTTTFQYSCYDPSKPYPAGTIIYNNGTKTVTSFCSTDLCNTGTPTDTATLWCNSDLIIDSLVKQSCTGSCAVNSFFF